MSDHYDRYNGMENLLSTNLAEVGTDCISREQAINALERAKQNIHHNIERAIGDAVCEVLDAVENGIKQLPPIHPVNNSENPNGSDVISRQAAIDALGELATFTEDWSCNTWMYTDDVYNAIKQLPPIQPKRGKWIRTGGGSLYDRYECSECGKAPKWECMGDNRWKIAFTDFCPNCGAKMEAADGRD